MYYTFLADRHASKEEQERQKGKREVMVEYAGNDKIKELVGKKVGKD